MCVVNPREARCQKPGHDTGSWRSTRITLQILARCPSCDAGLPVPAGDAPAAIRCGRCGRDIPLEVTDPVRQDHRVDACPVCQGSSFYRRKDFDPKVGLTVVIIGAAASAGFYWFGRDLIAYSVLAAAALIDLLVYGRLKDVTVCYRCHTEFRGAYSRTAPAFDLHTADVLEQEYERRIGRR
jgi:hypothetical protein